MTGAQSPRAGEKEEEEAGWRQSRTAHGGGWGYLAWSDDGAISHPARDELKACASAALNFPSSLLRPDLPLFATGKHPLRVAPGLLLDSRPSFGSAVDRTEPAGSGGLSSSPNFHSWRCATGSAARATLLPSAAIAYSTSAGVAPELLDNYSYSSGLTGQPCRASRKGEFASGVSYFIPWRRATDSAARADSSQVWSDCQKKLPDNLPHRSERKRWSVHCPERISGRGTASSPLRTADDTTCRQSRKSEHQIGMDSDGTCRRFTRCGRDGAHPSSPGAPKP